MEIKAKFENGHFIPLDKVDLKEGEVVDLNLSKKKRFLWKGALKDLKQDSVELQHQIKETW